MRRKTIKIIGLLLSVLILCAPLGIPVFALDEMYEAIVAHNQTQYVNQMTGDDAFYSLVLPDYTDNIDSDNALIISQAKSITESCVTDYERIKAVHDWVADNIYYDLDYYYGYTSGTYVLASDVLKNKYTVCEGYANLMTALLRSLGIPTKGVLGYSIGGDKKWSKEIVSGPEGDIPNHKWNMVYGDSRWMNIDTTWDSTNYRLYGIKTEGGGITQDFFDITIEKLSFEHKIIGLDIGTPFYNRDSGFKYTPRSDRSMSIIGLISTGSETITIPALINGKAVSGIGVEAFDGNSSLKTVIVSRGISEIGSWAFFDCTSLTRMIIPSSVTTFGDLAVGYNTYGITGFLAKLSAVLTVYGAPGSVAEQYASNCGLPFKNAYTTVGLPGGAFFSAITPYSGLFGGSLKTVPDYAAQLTALHARDLAAYRLSLTGDAVPDGIIEIFLPIPVGFNMAFVYLYKINADGIKTPVSFTVDNGFLMFTDTAVNADYLITEETDNVLLLGDINDNGKIDIFDARTVLRTASGLTALTTLRKTVGDYDGSGGEPTVFDAIALLRKAAGLSE